MEQKTIPFAYKQDEWCTAEQKDLEPIQRSHQNSIVRCLVAVPVEL